MAALQTRARTRRGAGESEPENEVIALGKVDGLVDFPHYADEAV